MKAELLEVDAVNSLLKYYPNTGYFTWRKSRGGRRAGSSAGSYDSYGYVQIMINGRQYLAHRLAWLVVKGYWPEDTIDHINGIRDDNRVENLRVLTHRQNCVHRTKNPSNNRFGVLGIRFVDKHPIRPYEVRVGNKYIGSYRTLAEAKDSHTRAKQKQVEASFDES